MKNRWEIFTNRDNSISVSAYVGNGHGVHANMFPVNYEELFDIPDDVLFRANKCIISSAYNEFVDNEKPLLDDGISLNEFLNQISEGLLWKRHQGLCHTEMATKDSILTYLKYTKRTGYKEIIKIVNFEKVLEFERQKTLSRITSDTELDIYNRIINLQEIKDGYPILMELNDYPNIEFKDAALLLLKCKVYDIEDKHYLETKKHSNIEKETLKLYKKTLFSQIHNSYK